MMNDVPTTTPVSGCVECGAGFGDAHWPGCSALHATPGLEPGLGHAIRTCRDQGWAVAHVPGEGWRPCRPDEPDSYVDLSRYAFWLENGEGGLGASAGG
jgi:hypothetical protein